MIYRMTATSAKKEDTWNTSIKSHMTCIPKQTPKNFLQASSQAFQLPCLHGLHTRHLATLIEDCTDSGVCPTPPQGAINRAPTLRLQMPHTTQGAPLAIRQQYLIQMIPKLISLEYSQLIQQPIRMLTYPNSFGWYFP